MKSKVPVFATGGALIQASRVYGDYQLAPVGKKADYVLSRMGIVAGKPFSLQGFLGYWTPLILGVGFSAIASKVGANRYMKKVPFFNM